MRKNTISRMRLALAVLVLAGMAVLTAVSTRQVSADNAAPPSGSSNHQPKQYEIKDQAEVSASAENGNGNILGAIGNILSPRAQVVLPPPVPYTIVASTGAIDESALTYYGFTGPWVSYRLGSESVDPIEIRYNVTSNNLYVPNPDWNWLELTSHVPAAGSFVSATLFRVKPCTGVQEPLCTTTNNGSETPICTKCFIPPATLDFSEYVYYIRVVLDRNDQPEPPRAAALRLVQN